jgi:hypothetical protein
MCEHASLITIESDASILALNAKYKMILRTRKGIGFLVVKLMQNQGFNKPLIHLVVFVTG